MSTQSMNRYIAGAKLLIDNPISWPRFMLDKKLGRDSRHRLSFGDISLTLRTKAPDLTVVRACLLGEFDEAMAATDPQAKFIVDAGGYIGLVSVLLARRFPNARIVCLEPSTENFTLARQNCAPYKNVTVINSALGAESGNAILRDRGTGQWGFTITSSDDGAGSNIEGVKVVSLSDLMLTFKADRIDLLKLDIEGAEYELFEAADTWIDRCRVLFVELHEKFRPGVEALYHRATKGRVSAGGDAEKHLSVLK